MLLRYLFLLLALLIVSGVAEAGPANGWDLSPAFDVRRRQEILDGVYHFAPEQDRNWIRMRTRAGCGLSGHHQKFELRLVNEHRHFLHSDTDFDWDELIIDRLSWSWFSGETTSFTFGRQDIIWPGGFLMLEGHPLDGSRSIYHNAARLQTGGDWGKLDIALVHNPQQDDLVLSGDQEKILTNGDETGAAGRWMRGPWQGSLVWKRMDGKLEFVDLGTYTMGVRYSGPKWNLSSLEGEIALQYQDESNSTDDQDGWAMAAQAFLKQGVGKGLSLEAGGFYYSGSSDDLRSFRSPWGSWPKWSELYIYTLLGENTPGRVHVAAWENVAAPRLNLRRSLGAAMGRPLKARLGAAYLLAPEPDWQARGLLLQAELKFSLGGGFDGHLLWEMLDPGEFHDGSNGLAPLADNIHFLRWQLIYAFR
ncbi:MAG: hypothetical protein KOO60_03480 [Gemmatimonadales bacterium]|nr:hypothetical protein [Gemmatimonadales bacterium]